MKIRPARAELFHADGQKNGRTDMTRLIVTLRNSANAPKKFSLQWRLNEVKNVFLSASVSE
jgi:hypothetical protein